MTRPLEIPVSRLAELPRRDLVADFHCVTGWTAPGLRWGGLAFRTFYESVIVPEAGPRPGVTHVVFEGADGFRAALAIDDAFDEEVMLADRLGESALDGDHGAPVRLVSPKQYGYKNTKHLCGVELHTREPQDGYRKGLRRRVLKWLVTPHPRARVSQEERHRYLPAWVVRGLYRVILRPLWLRGFQRHRNQRRDSPQGKE